MNVFDCLNSDGDFKFSKKVAKEIGLTNALVLGAIKQYVKDYKCSEIDMGVIKSRYLSFLSKSTIKRALKSLHDTGFLTNSLNDSEMKKNIVLENKRNPKYVCEWCGCKCNLLNKHHFPIPKSQGGTETVNICPNCHYEFHALSDYKLNETI